MQQNIEMLRGLRAFPPRDIESASGRAHRMTVQELEAQTQALHDALKRALANPEPPRPRKSWRDIDLKAPATGGVR